MEKINIEKLKTIINKELKEKNILYTNLFIHKVYLNHNIEIEKDSLSNIIKSNDNLVEVSQNIFMEKEFIKSKALKESDRFIRTSYYEWTISENCNKEFEMGFEKSFSNLKTVSEKKDRFEIIERYVLNEKQETLQCIGEDYGLTREES